MPCEKCPRKGTEVPAAWVISEGFDTGALVDGVVVVEVGFVVASVLVDVIREIAGLVGGARKSSHMFFPMAQTSSQLRALTSRPWVLQSQATSQAKRVMASMNSA